MFCAAEDTGKMFSMNLQLFSLTGSNYGDELVHVENHFTFVCLTFMASVCSCLRVLEIFVNIYLMDGLHAIDLCTEDLFGEC